jgi:hypothetical protein
MPNTFLFFILAFCACVPALVIWKIISRRIQNLEQDLQSIGCAVSQMAEMHLKSTRKYSASLESLEERIMELSVPSHDTNLPLERRHQVLTLANRGMSLEDIVKHLKAPVGEAELILNLGRYTDTEGPGKVRSEQQVRQYA